MQVRPGDSFDRYTIEALIGEGGMGQVYRAHDQRLRRRVALKLLRLDRPELGGAGAVVRLLHEARAAAALDHPGSVAIFDVGEVGGVPFIAMEYVVGRSLRE
jgi:serine/threonine protein kinase